MKKNRDEHSGVFQRAWEAIDQDDTIPPEEKEGVLKLIQVLIEAAESSRDSQKKDGWVEPVAREIISKHSLLTLVRQQADELDSLKSISLNLTSSLEFQTVLDAVVSEAMRLVKNSRSAHIFLYSHGRLEFGASLNMDGERNKVFAMPRPHGLTYTVANHGEQLIVEDILSHPLFKDVPRDWGGSIIGVPLKFNNAIVGVMNLSRSTTGGFTGSELRLIGLLADHAATAIFNASLHRGVTELANTDSVTGLPNRRALDERLQEEMRRASRINLGFSVVMMDLDGFKHVNDTFGHSIGDDVLHDVFNYLAGKMRSMDFLARYGGDELTLVMRDSGQAEAELVTKRIIDWIREYVFPVSASQSIRLGITAGIAVYPLHSRTASDLLRAADAALYQAKKYKRGSYVIARGATGPLDPLTLNTFIKD
ncbi:MAG: sensor domain-containing diguanylate cyclase [Anaerolineales bacterium]|nr:MAG: sensor domain-containing diguanylate cyclase [Anaerolineales bacterium]